MTIDKDCDAAALALLAEDMMAAYDRLKLADELQTANDEMSALKGGFDTWSDGVQDALETYLTGTISPLLDQLNADIPSGTYKSVVDSTSKLATEFRSLERDQKAYQEAKDEWDKQCKIGQYTYYYTIKDSSDKEVRCAADTPGSTEHKEERKEYKDAYDKYYWTGYTIAQRVHYVINPELAKMAGYSFGAQAAPPPAPPPAEEPNSSNNAQVIDGGVIVDGIQYQTVPVGQNLVHGNLDKGDYIVYQGQVYTWGGSAGWGKGCILISMDGKQITITAQEAAGCQFVSHYYRQRGTPVGDSGDTGGGGGGGHGF